MYTIPINESPYSHYRNDSTKDLVIERETLIQDNIELDIKISKKEPSSEGISEFKNDILNNEHKIDYINNILEERKVTKAMIDEILREHEKEREKIKERKKKEY